MPQRTKTGSEEEQEPEDAGDEALDEGPYREPKGTDEVERERAEHMAEVTGEADGEPLERKPERAGREPEGPDETVKHHDSAEDPTEAAEENEERVERGTDEEELVAGS